MLPTSANREKIDHKRIVSEGANFQIVYDIMNANFYLYEDDYIVPYLLETFLSPIVDERGANRLLMWYFEQWSDIARMVAQEWPIVDGRPNDNAVKLSFRVISMLNTYSFKPHWYSAFYGAPVELLVFPWLGGVFQFGVSFDECVKELNECITVEQWSQLKFPYVAPFVEIVEPEVIEPLSIVLLQKCDVYADVSLKEDVPLTYVVAQYCGGAQDDNLKSVIDTVIHRFYTIILNTLIPYYEEYSTSIDLYGMGEALRHFASRYDKMRLDYSYYYKPYQLRLMHFLCQNVIAFIVHPEFGLRVVQRILVRMANDAVDYVNISNDGYGTLYIVPNRQQLLFPYGLGLTGYEEQIKELEGVMRNVCVDRGRYPCVLSMEYMRELASIRDSSDKRFESLKLLSTVARVYLPFTQFDASGVMAELYTRVAEGVPWLQMVNRYAEIPTILHGHSGVVALLHVRYNMAPFNVSYEKLLRRLPVEIPERKRISIEEALTYEPDSGDVNKNPVSALHEYAQKMDYSLRVSKAKSVVTDTGNLWVVELRLECQMETLLAIGKHRLKKMAKRSAAHQMFKKIKVMQDSKH